VKYVDITDFYFNGRYLSSFGGMVAGLSGYTNMNLMPSREYITDRPIRYDGARVFDTYLSPRIFSVPVVFTDLDKFSKYDISAWLNTKTEQDFYFKDDNKKLKCRLDSGAVDLNRLGVNSYATELRFIAHDPYFYEIEETILEGTKAAGIDTLTLDIYSNSTIESYPLIRLSGITLGTAVSIKSSEYGDSVSWSLSESATNIEIDSLNSYIKDYDIDYNLYGYYSSTIEESWWPVFPAGRFTITVTFADTAAIDYYIKPRYRWL